MRAGGPHGAAVQEGETEAVASVEVGAGEEERVERMPHVRSRCKNRMCVVDEVDAAASPHEHVLEVTISRGEEKVEDRRADERSRVELTQPLEHPTRARALCVLLVWPLRVRTQQHVDRDAGRHLGRHRRPALAGAARGDRGEAPLDVELARVCAHRRDDLQLGHPLKRH